MNPVLAVLVLLLSLSFPVAAQEIGTLTLLEGSLHVIRGTTVLLGVQGMRLRQGDILENSNPGFAQLEFTEGTVVALGPSSRVFLMRYAARNASGMRSRSATAELVLLNGWLKGENHSKNGIDGYDTPLLAATTRQGTIVLHASPQAVEIFVESGPVNVEEVNHDGSLRQAVSGKDGQFFSRQPDKSVSVQSHLDPTFLESMPTPFRDTLPSRLSHFAGRRVEPKREHEVTYSEIEPWLTMGRRWREGFVPRFEPLLKDPEFRKALAAHLNQYPEWDPILHPEKYESKTPKAVGNPDTQQGRRDPQ
jgi:hypothetical protein